MNVRMRETDVTELYFVLEGSVVLSLHEKKALVQLSS